MSDFHAPECCFCDDILKNPSASGGVAPRPLPGALPLDPTGGLLQPPNPRIIFLLFHFSPVPCLISALFFSLFFFPALSFLSLFLTKKTSARGLRAFLSRNHYHTENEREKLENMYMCNCVMTERDE